MIKYINRILYALIAALGLMFVYNLTVANVKTSYLKEQGQIELDAGNYKYFISSRFYDETPIFDETLTCHCYSIGSPPNNLETEA